MKSRSSTIWWLITLLISSKTFLSSVNMPHKSVSLKDKIFISTYHLSCLPTEKITFQNAPSPQEFNEGDDADIVCDVTSSPPPAIYWKHKGQKVQFEKDGKPVQMKLFQCLSYFLTSSLPSHLFPLTPWAVTSPSCQCCLPIAFQSICHTVSHLLLLLPIIYGQNHTFSAGKLKTS